MISSTAFRTASKYLLRNRKPQVSNGIKSHVYFSTKKPESSSGEKNIGDGKNEFPLGLGKAFGLTEVTDNLIPTNKDREFEPGYMPEFLPDDVKKDMKELGIDSIEELDEMEEHNIDGYNDLGLVPPEGTGTYSSPILIPSRRTTRVVGYVEPVSHSLQWFVIHNDGNKYYLPDLGLFFSMLHIPDEEASASH